LLERSEVVVVTLASVREGKGWIPPQRSILPTICAKLSAFYQSSKIDITNFFLNLPTNILAGSIETAFQFLQVLMCA
jgi:hypothetical protein